MTKPDNTDQTSHPGFEGDMTQPDEKREIWIPWTHGLMAWHKEGMMLPLTEFKEAMLSDPDWRAWLEKHDNYGWSRMVTGDDYDTLEYPGFFRVKNKKTGETIKAGHG